MQAKCTARLEKDAHYSQPKRGVLGAAPSRAGKGLRVHRYAQGRWPAPGGPVAGWAAMEGPRGQAGQAVTLTTAVGSASHGLDGPPPRSADMMARDAAAPVAAVGLGPVPGTEATELSVKEGNCEVSICNDLSYGK